MSVTRAVFLWHLHQPEYRDPASGQPLLPWVRLHATRAYNDMAAALERHPKARVVANWAPSLLIQLDAYASGRTTDKDEALARKPVSDLTPAERAHVVKESFSVDWESARRAMPHATLPPRFQHPEDAREQIRRGRAKAAENFGQPPVGMWPSEGSVSPEVLDILGSEGVRWIATDQGNLERSEK